MKLKYLNASRYLWRRTWKKIQFVALDGLEKLRSTGSLVQFLKASCQRPESSETEY